MGLRSLRSCICLQTTSLWQRGHTLASLWIYSMQKPHFLRFPLLKIARTTPRGPKKNPMMKPRKPSPLLDPITVAVKQHTIHMVKRSIWMIGGFVDFRGSESRILEVNALCSFGNMCSYEHGGNFRIGYGREYASFLSSQRGRSPGRQNQERSSSFPNRAGRRLSARRMGHHS